MKRTLQMEPSARGMVHNHQSFGCAIALRQLTQHNTSACHFQIFLYNLRKPISSIKENLMIGLRWGGILMFALLGGVLVVQYLVAPPMEMTIWALALLLVLAGLIWLMARFSRGKQLAAGLLLALAGLTGGYLLAGVVFLGQEENRVLPVVQGVSARAEGHTAVIYLTHGEPPAYSPMPWIETFRELDHDQAPFIPTPLRPFFFHALRSEYLKTGGSPHNFVHETMRASLENMLRREGDQDTRVYLAFLDSNPRPDEMVIRAINNGANRVVISYVFLTISSHTQAGAELVEEVNAPQYGVEVCHTGALWDSPSLQHMFVERANLVSDGEDKAKFGILLVGHGQPAEWQKLYASQTEQENLFRQQVMERLVSEGYSREKIALAWMEFQEPEIGEVTRALGESGVETLLVYSASISAPSIHSEYDTPEAVREAGLPTSIKIVNMGAWGNDPLVIDAIREKLKGCGL
jgi:sirohydrochlorin ferrochelatase